MSDVDKLCCAIAVCQEKESENSQAQVTFRECEVRHAEMERLVEQQAKEVRKSGAIAQEKWEAAREATRFQTQTERRRAEMAQLYHGTPARRTVLQARREEATRRYEALQ